MSQRLVTDFITTSVPGAYPKVTVKSTPSGPASTGVVAIIGEAAGGADFSIEDLKLNYFTPDQADRVQSKYVSGPVVDAMRALASPSNDSNIPGSVSRVYILKTNAGAKASALMDTDYATISAKNWGLAGNGIKQKVIASQLEVTPEADGSTISAFGTSLNSKSFSIRLNGGATTVVTLSSNSADHSNVATLVIELNGQLPSGAG